MSRRRNDPEVLTPREAARYLGAQTEQDIETLRERLVSLVRAGQAPSADDGGPVRFHQGDLDRIKARMEGGR